MVRLLIAGLAGAVAVTPLLAQPAPVVRVAPVAPLPVLSTPVVGARAPMAPMTRASVQARVQAQFAKRDANRDGFLTAEELAVRGARGGQRNIVVRSDGGANGARAFDRLDANHDGSISRAEFGQARQIRIEKRVMVDGQPGAMGRMDQMGQPGRPGAMRMMRHGGGGMMGAMLLQRADANRDGRVSLAEATGAALQHFDMMDANRDGVITPDERGAARQRMMQMHKAG